MCLDVGFFNLNISQAIKFILVISILFYFFYQRTPRSLLFRLWSFPNDRQTAINTAKWHVKRSVIEDSKTAPDDIVNE